MGLLLSTRWSVSWPLFAFGAIGVVSGGLVAAAIAPAPTEHGAWAAAYLVLVVGVAQIALSAGQAWLAADAPSSRVVMAEAACWNMANALVVAGTITNAHPVVYVGGALLVAALAIFASGVRGAAPVRGKRWPVYVFRGLLALLLVSIPTGLVLATIRTGA